MAPQTMQGHFVSGAGRVLARIANQASATEMQKKSGKAISFPDESGFGTPSRYRFHLVATSYHSSP
jgi:hypothetical protein